MVGCVDACSQSNVVIVRPGDGTSVWLGGILDPATTASLCVWLAAGAPSPIPASLAGHVFDPRHTDAAPLPVPVPLAVGRS